MEQLTVKEQLETMIDYHTSLSEYGMKRAEQETNGSNIQHELREAAKFHAGQAAAAKEILEIIFG